MPGSVPRFQLTMTLCVAEAAEQRSIDIDAATAIAITACLAKLRVWIPFLQLLIMLIAVKQEGCHAVPALLFQPIPDLHSRFLHQLPVTKQSDSFIKNHMSDKNEDACFPRIFRLSTIMKQSGHSYLKRGRIEPVFIAFCEIRPQVVFIQLVIPF
jgi:hypothetical protein